MPNLSRLARRVWGGEGQREGENTGSKPRKKKKKRRRESGKALRKHLLGFSKDVKKGESDLHWRVGEGTEMKLLGGEI